MGNLTFNERSKKFIEKYPAQSGLQLRAIAWETPKAPAIPAGSLITIHPPFECFTD